MPTVLVVDDSVVDRRLAGGLLEKHFGCGVLYAADGKEALEQMGRQVPDLVLCDLQMPHMNGLELTATLKSDYPFVPIVLMTALGSEEIAAQALRQGAASYVPKRRLAEDLAPTVHRILLGSQEDHTHSELMHHLEAAESVFTLDNDPILIKALVSHVRQLLRCLPLQDETERLRVCLALEEALLNACYHGNLEVGDLPGQEELAAQRRDELPYRDRRIRVRVTVSREEAVFTVSDDGPGFDRSKLPTTATLAAAERKGGRGVILMRSSMDEVIYNDRGNEVKLIKRRAPEPSPAEDGVEGSPGPRA